MEGIALEAGGKGEEGVGTSVEDLQFGLKEVKSLHSLK